MHLVSVHAHLFWVFLGLSLAAPSAWADDESAREAPPRSAPPPQRRRWSFASTRPR